MDTREQLIKKVALARHLMYHHDKYGLKAEPSSGCFCYRDAVLAVSIIEKEK